MNDKTSPSGTGVKTKGVLTYKNMRLSKCEETKPQAQPDLLWRSTKNEETKPRSRCGTTTMDSRFHGNDVEGQEQDYLIKTSLRTRLIYGVSRR